MRIGQLADATGVTSSALRYYEEAGLLPPSPTSNGYRDYPAQAVERVTFLRHAQAADLNLRQIREVLAVRDAGQAPCQHVADHVADRLAEVEQRTGSFETPATSSVPCNNAWQSSTQATAHPRASARLCCRPGNGLGRPAQPVIRH